jgi:hypothetical protein
MIPDPVFTPLKSTVLEGVKKADLISLSATTEVGTSNPCSSIGGNSS